MECHFINWYVHDSLKFPLLNKYILLFLIDLKGGGLAIAEGFQVTEFKLIEFYRK